MKTGKSIRNRDLIRPDFEKLNRIVFIAPAKHVYKMWECLTIVFAFNIINQIKRKD